MIRTSTLVFEVYKSGSTELTYIKLILQLDQSKIASPLFLFSATAVQVYTGSGKSQYRHTSAQIVLALKGKLRVRKSPETTFSLCDVAIVTPNVNHRIIGSSFLEVMIWFDPATMESRAIHAHSSSELMLLSSNEINIPRSKLLQLSSQLQTCSQALLPETKAIDPLDERIVSTLTAIRNPALLGESYPLKYLAQKVNLSEGRLRHVSYSLAKFPENSNI